MDRGAAQPLVRIVARGEVKLLGTGDRRRGSRARPRYFRAAGRDSLTPFRHQGVFVREASGRALEISTEATADYPAMLIEPRLGKWDLRGYDAVTMKVANPEDVPLCVLLSIQNPGADGHNKCNVASRYRLGPRERRFTVPFGVWHGEKNHPLDQAEIVGLQVLLDKPGRRHRFVIDDLRAVRRERWDLEQVRTAPFFQQLQPAFRHSVNLSNALKAPPGKATGALR